MGLRPTAIGRKKELMVILSRRATRTKSQKRSERGVRDERSELHRSPLAVILSEASNASAVEGSRTASRKRSRYRFLVREALLTTTDLIAGRRGRFRRVEAD